MSTAEALVVLAIVSCFLALAVLIVRTQFALGIACITWGAVALYISTVMPR